MRSALLTLHLLALAAVVGSAFLHVLMAAVADPAAPDFAALMALKDTTTWSLILPGMVLLGMSGGLLARRLPRPWPLWLKAKLALVPVIAANGLLVLLPLGGEIAAAAAAGASTEALIAREDIFGTLNLVLLLAVVGLSVVRPRRRAAATATAPVRDARP